MNINDGFCVNGFSTSHLTANDPVWFSILVSLLSSRAWDWMETMVSWLTSRAWDWMETKVSLIYFTCLRMNGKGGLECGFNEACVLASLFWNFCLWQVAVIWRGDFSFVSFLGTRDLLSGGLCFSLEKAGQMGLSQYFSVHALKSSSRDAMVVGVSDLVQLAQLHLWDVDRICEWSP